MACEPIHDFAPTCGMSGEAEIIELVNVVKRYAKADSNAVDDISLAISAGEIFGLLGPNGAGKSTTVGILTTRILPSSGRARVDGIDVAKDPIAAHARLGVVPQRNNLDRSLSCRHNLLFHAAYHGVGRSERRRRASELLEQFGMADKAEAQVESLSGGQAQRVMIARALMHEPKALFLDEPTTGLDPAARLFVWDRIRELRDSGAAIMLCTHDMDEAATLADRVGVMDHGRLLALDAPEALVRRLPGAATLEVGLIVDKEDDVPQLWSALERQPGVERLETIAARDGVHRARLYMTGEAAAMVAPVSEVVSARGARLSEVGLSEPSLEDVFISLTGRRLQ